MGFRLVPKSVTLNDLEQRNGPSNSVALRAHYVKVLDYNHQQILSREMSQSTPTKHDGRAVLFTVAELLV